MEMLNTILLVLQVAVAVTLIGLILIQHGKGADAGAAFGSGASSTVFGARGSGNFLTKATSILALVFLLNSMGLAYLPKERLTQVVTNPLLQEQTTIIQEEQPAVTEEVPAIPAEPESDVPTLPAE